MEGYASMRSRVVQFLGENPDVLAVTLTRPKPKPRNVYKNGRVESFGVMPESCPIVHECINSILPLGTVVTEELREQLFQAIYSRVTDKFRDALNTVCNEKHAALKTMRMVMRELERSIENVESQDAASESGPGRGELIVEVEANPRRRAFARTADDEDEE